MATNAGGKWESIVNTALGGIWTLTLTDSGGTYPVITIPAGRYFVSTEGDGSLSLMAQLASSLNAASTSNDYTCTLSSSTGLITIAKGASTFSITWGSSVGLRSALGFTGNLASVSSETATSQSPAVWFPRAPWDCEVDLFVCSGYTVSDNSLAKAPDGTMVALGYNNRTENEMSYKGIFDRYVWTGRETVPNESLETFWKGAVISNQNPWASVGSPLRFYPDLTSDGTYHTYRSFNIHTFKPTRSLPPFVGLYDFSLALQIHVD